MDLQISVFLLLVLFTGGHSLSCYNCIGGLSSCDQKNIQCPTELTNCFSATITENSAILKIKSCAPSVCPTGSVNFGSGRVSSVCCKADLCNAQDAPDPSTNAPNGKKCYSCDEKSCSNTVSCSGSEDRCFNATASLGGQQMTAKGCASKSICDAPYFIPTVENVSCCEGNLCNSVNSVTQSVLFLCGALFSFILLH